ncbi:aldehyde dehydrogenase (NADP(+)) [Neorhodopirellula lusitana]|uniref:aldehyde dehydrogenase (NADP(+)) n=1 Tax=Neorhodopirellula lusitana TaxID=445327 RepID=UPI00384CDB54
MTDQDTFTAYNAATGLPLPGNFAEATAADIDKAVRSAEVAFEWLRECRPQRRGEFLRAVAAKMRLREPEILARCELETGYLPERVRGEFMRATGQLELFAGLAEESVWDVRQFDSGNPDRKPFPQPEMRRRMIPVGPVAVFGACNFPLAISVVGNDFVAAIAVGCPVVVKSHPSHPGTCKLLGEVVDEVVAEMDFPEGTFTLLHGRRPETSVALVQHPGIAAVGFTGSPNGGRALAQACLQRERPIPLFAELGSTNPVFLAPGFLASGAVENRLEAIASGFTTSLRFGNGHMCTKPGVVVMLDSQAKAFAEAVVDKMHAGMPMPMLSAGIADAFDQGVAKLADTTGVDELYGPRSARSDGAVPPDDQAASFGPWHRDARWFAVDAITAAEQNLLHCETFGPVSLLIRCTDEEQMLWVAKQFKGSLTATLHVDQEDAAFQASWLPIAERFAGRVIYNGWPTGMEIGAATHHGGPYPASLDGRSTSVGYASLDRFVRPVCYQGWPEEALSRV